ncbi:hypothetical protein L596_000417 [Steinernema carpocapsae]|uniref:Uncharacterized protein n=1 Tax=Steinernema carpocapsae TaxID=34508 RepID=A0A4U8UMA0_STECR|nr:hypothetical protein L596_000417 [Steinernema carpocapsae]
MFDPVERCLLKTIAILFVVWVSVPSIYYVVYRYEMSVQAERLAMTTLRPPTTTKKPYDKTRDFWHGGAKALGYYIHYHLLDKILPLDRACPIYQWWLMPDVDLCMHVQMHRGRRCYLVEDNAYARRTTMVFLCCNVAAWPVKTGLFKCCLNPNLMEFCNVEDFPLVDRKKKPQ